MSSNPLQFSLYGTLHHELNIDAMKCLALHCCNCSYFDNCQDHHNICMSHILTESSKTVTLFYLSHLFLQQHSSLLYLHILRFIPLLRNYCLLSHMDDLFLTNLSSLICSLLGQKISLPPGKCYFKNQLQN